MGKGPGENGKRVRLSPDERREQLLTLGVRMLSDRALEDISVGDIAAQAGISRGLLFHYFPTKQDFQLAVAQRANAELLARTAPDPSLGLFDMLRDAVQRYVDYVSENRTSYLALLRGPASTSPELTTLVDATRGAIVDRILAEVPVPIEDTDRPRLRLAVRGWIAFVEETTLSWLRHETITREQLIDMLVESLPALALSPELSQALRD
ncbi:TetR/AcrR family transcriptional regulator [Nocardia mexicana]|uniref:TetR family transcriptional regulator n=1 Tax=Nocardia mexicana TaxID=279262 RepID=A0A370H8U5_9NOCA|nr:TetR/AcrR family transcriptional regulator [Nocardia mexicana]RDI53077.1 TetR family transcriptional regulator [Nocardia mexicana]